MLKFKSLLSHLTFLVIGMVASYFLTSAWFEGAVAKHAIVDVAMNVIAIKRMDDHQDCLNLVESDLNLNIGRHLVNIRKYEKFIFDEGTIDFKNKQMRLLADHWNKYPPFENILNSDSGPEVKGVVKNNIDYVMSHQGR